MLADSLQLTISVYLNASVYCSGFPCQPCQLTRCNISLPYSVTPTYGPLLLGSLTGILTILQNQGLFLSLTLPTSSSGFDGCARSLRVGTSEVILQGSSEPLTLSDPPSAVPGCPRERHTVCHTHVLMEPARATGVDTPVCVLWTMWDRTALNVSHHLHCSLYT